MACFDGEHCFIRQNEDGWTRLIYINFVTRVNELLSPPKVTVLQFLGHNLVTSESYVIATGATNDFRDASVRHLYVIKREIDETYSFICMSCDITSPEDEKCTYVLGVKFSEDYSFFALTCSGPGPAYTYIFENFDPQAPFEWELNLELREILSAYLETQFEWMSVPVGDKYAAVVKCRLPECLDRTQNKTYAMIVDVYGGPDSVTALSNFAINFGDYLAQTRNVIYCNIDGRGSGNKGTDMLFTLNNKLGTVEIEDQIEVTKYLREKFVSFIDPHRIGIWGWSYGGYATGMVLSHDKDLVFQGGIAVAPVSDWKLYDTIYTERFMGLPSDNLDSYETARVTAYAKNMTKHKLLLIHGNADDNVHYQQSMVWAKELQHSTIMFEQQASLLDKFVN